MTILGELVAIQDDTRGYLTYVFKLTDNKEIEIVKFKYLTCVRFPNWECKELHLGDKGYVNFEIKKAGKDTWFDGTKLVFYNYDFTQFINIAFPGVNEVKSCIM
jgi:hypothetical protein